MMVILKQNGLWSGGLNFDAKVRRSSIDSMDLFYAHIGGMDAFTRGLVVAHQIIQDKALSNFIDERYSSFTSGIGAQIMSGKAGLEDADKWVLQQGAPVLQSAQAGNVREYSEFIFIRLIFIFIFRTYAM